MFDPKFYNDIMAVIRKMIQRSNVLLSISAVYTQSGTVYDTDDLDSLKSDLVVTAYYDDESSEILESYEYTLSGNLEIGTSTITVSYDGKIDTFTVIVTEKTVAEGIYTPSNVVRGSYIDENGDVQTSTDNSGYFAEYIALDTSKKYWLQYTNSSASTLNWRITEYDSSKTFIKQTHLEKNGDNRTAILIPTSANTKYIRLGWYNSSSTSFVPSFSFTYCTALPMSIGGINATTGADETDDHRIRSGYLDAGASMSFSGKPFGGVWQKDNRTGGYAFRCYDSNHSFVGSLTNNGGLFTNDITSRAYPTNTAYVRIFMNYPTGTNYTFTSGWSVEVTELIVINGTKYCLTED